MDKIDLSNVIHSLAISLILGFVLFLCGYGVYSALFLGMFSVRYSVVFFIFAVVLVLSSKFVENRGAEFPNYILGGAIISVLVTFAIVSIYNGALWIVKNGLPNVDVTLFGIGTATIVSFVMLSLLTSSR